MLKTMEETNCDIVIVSRFLDGKMPLRMRTIGGKIISTAIKMTENQYITDPTSGMRLFKRNIVRVFAENEFLTPEPDTIAYFLRMGADVREVQVKMNDRMHGQSYLSPINATKYMIKVLKSIIFSYRKWEVININKVAEKPKHTIGGSNS